MSGAFSLLVSLPMFPEPVDVYLANQAPDGRPSLVLPDLSVQPFQEVGLVPWLRDFRGPLLRPISLFEIPLSEFPAGHYYFYLAITPTGRIDDFWLWITDFETGNRF